MPVGLPSGLYDVMNGSMEQTSSNPGAGPLEVPFGNHDRKTNHVTRPRRRVVDNQIFDTRVQKKS